MDEDSLRAAMKAEIRTRRRAVRRAMPSQARAERSSALCRRLTELIEWNAARTVLAFVSMRTEVQTMEAVAAARGAGKRTFAPRLAESREDLEIREWREDAELEESGMMFLQPPDKAPTIAHHEIDLVLVPALAADETGHRIGFGRGFYDRLLPRLTRAHRIALIFDFELVAEVPAREGDERVDIVVTDAQVIRTGRVD